MKYILKDKNVKNILKELLFQEVNGFNTLISEYSELETIEYINEYLNYSEYNEYIGRPFYLVYSYTSFEWLCDIQYDNSNCYTIIG